MSRREWEGEGGIESEREGGRGRDRVGESGRGLRRVLNIANVFVELVVAVLE